MSTSGTDDTIAPRPSGLEATAAPGTSGLDDTVAPQPSGLEATVAPAPSGVDATLAVGSAPPPPSPGSTHASTRLGVVDYSVYKFDRALSRGGMGKISIVTDQRLRRTVALKEVLADDAGLHTRFLREAEITAQLQHPSVVPIYEAGYWPNREPFYAMKLVEGRPLSNLIEKAATIRERLALLPNLVAISDALSYAHARRIIHRDLKPDNVLVGEYGETVVIDWGLAKRLGTDEDLPSSGPAQVEEGDHTATQAGAVLGTPAFMAPEQARGEAIDERADVYALGAILYNVLTGKIPYADSKSVVELMARLQDEAPRPLLALVPDAPVDLVAIVEKAMARAPADRYASAKELADDLRRYTTGQLVGAHSYSLRQLLGRWIRKHRGPLAVAGVAALAIVVLAVVGLQRIRRERNVAEAQRTEARAHRADVESLLDFMLTDLRASLKKTGSLSALAGAVTRTQDYFATHDPGDAPDDLARGAQAMRSVAQVLAAQGKTDESIAAYEQAAAIAQRGLRRHPGHARLYEVWWLARSLTARGQVAKNGLERADAILAELDLAAIPATLDDDTRDLLGASRAFTATTIAYTRGDLKAARQACNDELAPRMRRSARKPDDSERVVEHVSVYSELARIALRDWDLPAARAAAEKGLDVLTAPLARDPADQELRMARSTMLERVAAVAQAEGKQADALATYREVLRIADDLHQLDGTNVDYLRQLSLTENKVSTALLNHGDVAEAKEHQKRSTAIAEQLHERDPGNDVWTRDLSIAYDRETSITSQTGKVEEALGFARKSEALRVELLARHPEDANAHRDLGIARALIGEMLQGLGRMPDAVEVLRKGEENFAALVKLEPDTLQHQVDACEIGKKLGYVLAGSGDVEGGLAVLERVWSRLEALVQRPEATDMWRAMLGQTSEAYAEVLLGAKRQDDAARVLKRGVEVLEKLVAAQPDEVIYAQELTGALALQSMALDRPATATDAVASLSRARTMIDALVAKYPDHAGLRNYQQIITSMKVSSAPAP